MKNVFNGIPVKNLEKIEKIVARLNKKGYPTTLTIDNLCGKVVDISLDSANMELGQWDIMGVKDNVLGVASYYGTIPEQYHNDDFICDHCNSHRHRNVVILKHKETGELKQVGTTCLRDFTGVETGSLLDELHRINRYIFFVITIYL